MRPFFQRSLLLYTLIFFNPVSLAYAQAPADSTALLMWPECADEKTRLCATVNEPGALSECLLKNETQLSVNCRQSLTRLLEAKKGAASRGGGALAAFGGLNAMGPPVPLFTYDGRSIPGKEGGPYLTEHKMNLSLPVLKTEKDTLAVSLAAGQVHLNRDVTLDSGLRVPTELTRIEIGAQYFHQLEGKRNWGLRGSVGYAGDDPFDSMGDTTFSINDNYGFPGSGRGYWMTFVFLSNNNPIANYVPIPGVAYIYKTETFSGMFGFPILSMQWTPVNPWIYSLALFGPTLQLESAYGQLGDRQIFTAYNFTQQNYIPSQRAEDRDRLTLQEQRLALGVRWPLRPTFLLEAQAGRAFERSVYIGKGSFKKERGSANLPSNWFGSWGIRWVF